MNFLEEASPPESLKAEYSDKEVRKKNWRGTDFSFTKSWNFYSRLSDIFNDVNKDHFNHKSK